uniref:Uncharacterized protein n=1 Tax=Arundo donax TaxID=35708 RepID=A0A0A9HQP5_ARUDO
MRPGRRRSSLRRKGATSRWSWSCSGTLTPRGWSRRTGLGTTRCTSQREKAIMLLCRKCYFTIGCLPKHLALQIPLRLYQQL